MTFITQLSSSLMAWSAYVNHWGLRSTYTFAAFALKSLLVISTFGTFKKRTAIQTNFTTFCNVPNCHRVYTMTQGREFNGSTNTSLGGSEWEFGTRDCPGHLEL